MLITNNHNYPQIVYNAVLNVHGDYDKGDADISVSQLVAPARQYFLEKEYGDVLEKDMSDMIDALEGTALHWVIERGRTKEVIEERTVEEINGWKVSGKFDMYDPETKTLWDWKRVNINEYIFGTKKDKVEKLNVYAYLNRNKYKIEKLYLGFFYSNWEKAVAARSDEKDYPPRKILIQEVPMWGVQEQKDFIEGRLAEFEKMVQTNELPFCTDEERWVRPQRYACTKAGRKSAVRVFDTLPEAEAYCKAERLTLEVRKGEQTIRCRYCDVAQKCDQFKELMSPEEREAYLKNKYGRP